jgi:hypothetical protein
MAPPALMLALLVAGAGAPTVTVPGDAPAVTRGLVLVLSPEVEDEVTHNAMVRISGELAAAPFGVVSARVDPSVDVMEQVETAGRDLEPVAAFAIVRETSDRPGSVAVWVSNRLTHTTTVQRVQVRGGDVDGAAAHLAIEAVELVRASMAGLWPRAPGTTEPAGEVTAPAAPPPAAPAPAPGRLTVGAGVAQLRDVGGAPAFWAPTVAFWYGQSERVAARLILTGLGPGAEVTASDGSGGARLQRATAELGLVRRFRPGAILQPMLAVGAGAAYVGAQGNGAPANRVYTESAWSALGAAGGGVAVALGPHLALAAEARLLLMSRSVVVRVWQTDTATFNRATVLGDVGLLATF